MTGITVDLAGADEILPLFHRKEFPRGVPGVGNQRAHNTARVASAHMPTSIGLHRWSHGSCLSTHSPHGDLSYGRPTVFRGGDYLGAVALLISSLFRGAIGACRPVRIHDVTFGAFSSETRRYICHMTLLMHCLGLR